MEPGEFWRVNGITTIGMWSAGLGMRDRAPLFLLPGLSCLCLKARSALSTFQNPPGLCKMPCCGGRAQAGPQGQELVLRGAHGDGLGWVPPLGNEAPLSTGAG